MAMNQPANFSPIGESSKQQAAIVDNGAVFVSRRQTDE